jgi:glycosyltransferase involved in cell wall biosynthesis
MFLSAVITTYNRADVLEENLDAFSEQSDKNFEVVVAIDGSTDHTVSMLEEYDNDFPLRWVDTGETNKYCLAKARNLGILETTGDVVAVLDDDSFPCKDFVASHKQTTQQRVLTGGCRSSHDPEDSLHPKMERLAKEYGIKTPTQIKSLLVENNCCMLRQDWIGCGMFCERFEGYGGTGQEFIHRLAYLGFAYQYNPDAKIYHHREFEGNNGVTREIKNEQAQENIKLLQKFYR